MLLFLFFFFFLLSFSLPLGVEDAGQAAGQDECKGKGVLARIDMAAKVEHLDANLKEDVLAMAVQLARAHHVLVPLADRVGFSVRPSRVLLARDLGGKKKVKTSSSWGEKRPHQQVNPVTSKRLNHVQIDGAGHLQATNGQ